MVHQNWRNPVTDRSETLERWGVTLLLPAASIPQESVRGGGENPIHSGPYLLGFGLATPLDEAHLEAG